MTDGTLIEVIDEDGPQHQQTLSEEFGRFYLVLPWIVTIFSVTLSVILFFSDYWWLTPIPLAAILMLRFKRVPATDPPSVGIHTVWGRVVEETLDPLYYLTLPFFPFFQSIKLITMKFRELTFNFKNVPCRTRLEEAEGEGGAVPVAGGTVDVELGMAIGPDKDRLISFILSGGTEASHVDARAGTETELDDIVFNNNTQAVQELSGYHTWEEMIYMPKVVVGAYLLEKLCGEMPLCDRQGNRLPSIDPSKVWDENEDKEQIERYTEAFRLTFEQNKAVAIKKWGFVLRQFKVGPILPPEVLRNAALRIDEEKQKRREESIENETMRRLAKSILEASRPGTDAAPTISYEVALQIARIQKGVSTERIERIITQSAEELPSIEKAGIYAGRGKS